MFLAAGTDFDGTSPLTQTFVSGSTVGDRVYFDIPIFDDDIVEKEEFFSALLNADAKIHTEIAFVQITDKDSELEQTTCYHLAFYVNLIAAACANFSQSVYEVKESSGSVEICVDGNGILEDYLTVYLFTIPGTATGKPIQFFIAYSFSLLIPLL